MTPPIITAINARNHLRFSIRGSSEESDTRRPVAMDTGSNNEYASSFARCQTRLIGEVGRQRGSASATPGWPIRARRPWRERVRRATAGSAMSALATVAARSDTPV
jgi:hypothetical protein